MFPTAEYVEVALKSAAFWPVDEGKQELARFQADLAMKAAVAEWETLTGWAPFLAGSVAAERFFEGTDPAGYLDFEGGAVEVVGVSINGQSLAVGQQYWAQPGNAVSRGGAFTGLQLAPRFASPLFNRPGSLRVTARWGRVEEWPADVFQAILQRAFTTTLKQIENLQSISSISQDGFNKQFDVVGILTQKDVAEIGDRDFLVTAGRWKRVVV